MIGPTLPPELNKREEMNDKEITISFSDDEDDYGPSLPQTKGEAAVIGPAIPDHIIKHKRVCEHSEDQSVRDNKEVDVSIGPSIPAHLLQNKQAQTEEEEPSADDFAPALPPDLLEQRIPYSQISPVRRRRPIGPTLPSGPLPVEEEEDVIVGPALPKDYNREEEDVKSAITAIEERARQSKEYMVKKDTIATTVERPDWMLLPPEVDYLKTATSSKSRQFSNRTMSQSERDSSGWTQTPADKERRLNDGKRKTEEMSYSSLDYEKHKNIEAYNKSSRPLSLMELHQQKKHKHPPREDITKRPFDRDKDLMGARPMNRKQKKEMISQSGQFSDKFGHGRSSFL